MEQINEEGKTEWFEIMSQDKDTVMVLLDTLKEQMEIKANEMEGRITANTNTEWTQREEAIKGSQEARNRDIIQEIVKTCKGFEEGIKQKMAHMKTQDNYQ